MSQPQLRSERKARPLLTIRKVAVGSQNDIREDKDPDEAWPER